jgi:hypothetical protein
VTERPIPLIGDIALDAVQTISHQLDAGFAPMRIAGLDGEVQQRAGRPSHRIVIEGLLIGDGAKDALGKLQAAATAGDELTFAADIISALDLSKVVIRGLSAEETAGRAQRIAYRLDLAESPPLPPPAEVSGGFGGLDGLGLDDLGLDPGVLGDIADLASEAAAAVDQAMGAIDALSALAALADGGLDFGGMLDPLKATTDAMPAIASQFSTAAAALGAMFEQ